MHTEMNESLVGTTIGRYEMQEQIGRGGMAAVYRGFQPSLGRAVAVKVLSLAQLPDPTLPERFRREAQLVAGLTHPSIVPVYDFGEWERHLYIVMMLVPGGTLRDRLDGRLPVGAVVQLVGQIADGLGYAHSQGIVHLDVKPSNILLASTDWAMLGDFGIARALSGATDHTANFGASGTPAYMAPEQWRGGVVDGRADIYSLGIVLYQLLTGAVPFTAPTVEGVVRQHLDADVPPLAQYRPDLPGGFAAVIQRALAKEPERRFRHAGEFKAALLAAGRSGPTTGLHLSAGFAPPPPPMPVPQAGETMRVPPHLVHARTAAQSSSSSRTGSVLIALVIILTVLLASAGGYIAAGGLSSGGDAPTPSVTDGRAAEQPATSLPPAAQVTPTTAAQAAPPPPAPATPQPTPTAPRPTTPPAAAEPTNPPAPVAQAEPPTAVQNAPEPAPATNTPPPPATAAPTVPAAAPTAPPPAPAPTTAPPPPKPTLAQPPAQPKPQATAKPATDQRLALVERHVGDYFAALNAGDYARAQASCCTPAWRAKYPLETWQRNFDGVTDLRFDTPFRYTSVEPSRIVAEVDYSFTNASGGARRFFTLRWTFVPVGNDWLADDAVAGPQS